MTPTDSAPALLGKIVRVKRSGKTGCVERVTLYNSGLSFISVGGLDYGLHEVEERAEEGEAKCPLRWSDGSLEWTQDDGKTWMKVPTI